MVLHEILQHVFRCTNARGGPTVDSCDDSEELVIASVRVIRNELRGTASRDETRRFRNINGVAPISNDHQPGVLVGEDGFRVVVTLAVSGSFGNVRATPFRRTARGKE
jgi:hypothetical protein